MVGYRLQPGAIINEWELMQLLGTDHPDEVEVVDLVREFVTVDYIVEHALEGLSQTNSLVNEVAKQLGLSTRSLQRRMLSATGRSPVYWAQLARIRRAARMLCQNPGFSTAANESGFADQAHFNREFRRWLGVTPGMFLANNDMTGVIQHSGYDGVSTGEHISTKKPLGSVT